MAKDEEDKTAKDGKPEDELARKRGETPNGSDPLAGEGKTGKTLEEQAAAGTEEEEEDGQFAIHVEEHGRKVKLSTLVKRGTPVKYEFKLGGKGVKGAGNMGLIGFDDPDIILLVPCRAGKVEADPTYEADGSIKFVTIRQHAKPMTAYDAKDPQARAAVFGEEQEPEPAVP